RSVRTSGADRGVRRLRCGLPADDRLPVDPKRGWTSAFRRQRQGAPREPLGYLSTGNAQPSELARPHPDPGHLCDRFSLAIPADFSRSVVARAALRAAFHRLIDGVKVRENYLRPAVDGIEHLERG